MAVSIDNASDDELIAAWNEQARLMVHGSDAARRDAPQLQRVIRDEVARRYFPSELPPTWRRRIGDDLLSEWRLQFEDDADELL